ncbi:hypothetical protein PG994_005675 [Apiospora phragmitis]|uniref:Uncharacterized protein n=1 Tax=Apiospora phragmitis TaxID=2905665 RepID=A0ABR1VCW7_9PEZI
MFLAEVSNTVAGESSEMSISTLLNEEFSLLETGLSNLLDEVLASGESSGRRSLPVVPRVGGSSRSRSRAGLTRANGQALGEVARDAFHGELDVVPVAEARLEVVVWAARHAPLDVSEVRVGALLEVPKMMLHLGQIVVACAIGRGAIVVGVGGHDDDLENANTDQPCVWDEMG